MSQTTLRPGRSAVKYRLTRSGMFAAASASASSVIRNGRGWQGTKPSWHMIWRTSSGERSVLASARTAWIRRYSGRSYRFRTALSVLFPIARRWIVVIQLK